LHINPNTQSPLHIDSSAGIITTALKEQQAIQTADLQVQVRCATEGRVYNINDTVKRKCVVVKLAIPSNANSDQAPTTAILEEVINAIISHLSFTFPINIVALFNYSVPVDNAKQTGSNYYSFAYLSPRSNQKHTTDIKKPNIFLSSTRGLLTYSNTPTKPYTESRISRQSPNL
jgi:hypothetical protein